jgi:hypothetical protein
MVANVAAIYSLATVQIMVSSEASGSSDTKAGTRVLLITTKLIVKGLMRSILMGIAYGILIAIHGSQPEQLTPLTQVIMGGFQVCT